MAGLRIKHYAKTGIIRSVGDPPNGIVGISNRDETGCVFIVHPKVEPRVTGLPGLNVERISGDPAEGGGVPVTAEEVVEAALGCDRTIAMLYRSVLGNVEQMARDALGTFVVEDVIAAAQLAKEVRDQMAVNGLISKREP